MKFGFKWKKIVTSLFLPLNFFFLQRQTHNDEHKDVCPNVTQSSKRDSIRLYQK